jgi:hypothetical protein
MARPRLDPPRPAPGAFALIADGGQPLACPGRSRHFFAFAFESDARPADRRGVAGLD